MTLTSMPEQFKRSGVCLMHGSVVVDVVDVTVVDVSVTVVVEPKKDHPHA